MDCYEVTHFPDGRRAITCGICRLTSHDPGDIDHRYCGHCKAFLTDVPRTGSRPPLRYVRMPGVALQPGGSIDIELNRVFDSKDRVTITTTGPDAARWLVDRLNSYEDRITPEGDQT